MREALVDDLEGLQLPLEKLRAMGESVKLQHTFGTIALEYWVNDLVAPKSEIDAEIRDLRARHDREVRRLAEELVQLRMKLAREELSPEHEMDLRQEIELIAAENACNELALRRKQFEAQAVIDARQRLAQVRAALVAMDKPHRVAVLEQAVRDGHMQGFDLTIVENIQYFADKLLPVVEGL